ncbi:MAG: PhnD/SsuA/transferrin family substrate-binding protein, partial [Phycisphaerales bacterium]|nr:PhnD/SsuA/transferrin family substrate-binding protein [Phycisphaerales bacterium]
MNRIHWSKLDISGGKYLRSVGLIGMALLSLAAGCSTVAHVVDPLNLRGLGQQPIRVGITRLEFPPPLFVPKHSLFNDNMAIHLNKPVCFELLNPRQIRVHLGTGRLHFAMLSAGDFEQVASADTYEILAVPKDMRGRTIRQGLIVVAPNSPWQSLGDLKNQHFHFLQRDDSLNDAALGALLAAGISKSELSQGFLGLGTNLGMRHINSVEVAKRVVLDPRAAGVIDEDDYSQWMQTGGSLMLLNPSRDEVRVIARTVAVPA